MCCNGPFLSKSGAIVLKQIALCIECVICITHISFYIQVYITFIASILRHLDALSQTLHCIWLVIIEVQKTSKQM